MTHTLDFSSPNWDVVDYLLNNSFSASQYDIKLTIKRNGRATPSMPLLLNVKFEKNFTAFFSWQIEETTDIAYKGQLSVIFITLSEVI
nr:unnamed protein product [Callosobruchus chinensis]